MKTSAPEKKIPGLRKFLKILAIGFFTLLILLYVVLPASFGAYASFAHPRRVGIPPRGFSGILLKTADDTELAAWYCPPSNGAVIIVLHGATDSRNGVRNHCTMLSENGYGVLAFDLRGHGESGGRGNAFGWNGTGDVAAALAFLRSQPGIGRVGGLGLSLGGEILLGAASGFPELTAIVAEGATGRTIDDYVVLPSRKNLFRSWTTRVMYAAVGLFTGDDPPFTILESVEKSRETRFLLIASGKVPDETEYGGKFREAAADRAELWIAAEAGHTGGYSRYPTEYREKVLGFFTCLLAP